jgi:acetyltransferase-like isoleucine patch superfamily enzyme
MNERQRIGESTAAGGGTKLLDESKFIRQKMFARKSLMGRYRDIVAGPEFSWLGFLRLELVQLLFGGVPGALGLMLRKIFYPGLFGHVGKGCIFGRHLTLRHPRKVYLGAGVVIDERCVLDGHGAGDEGVVIGDRVILNRGCVVQAKIGPISIGNECDLGADTTVISQGATHIGTGVSIGGGGKIGGGSIQLGGLAAAATEADAGSFVARGQVRFSRGDVQIGDFVVMGRAAMVMDGATIGRGSVVAAGAIVRGAIPDNSVVTLVQRLSVVPRNTFTGEQRPAVEHAATSMEQTERDDSAKSDDIDGLLRAAIDEANRQNPVERYLSPTGDGPLLEPDGPLDSMSLINLIVALEEQVELVHGRTLLLADTWGIEGVPATVDELRSRLEKALRD